MEVARGSKLNPGRRMMTSSVLIYLLAVYYFFGAVYGSARSIQNDEVGLGIFVFLVWIYLGVQLVRRQFHAWAFCLVQHGLAFLNVFIGIMTATLIREVVDLSNPWHRLWLRELAVSLLFLVILLLPPVWRAFRKAGAVSGVSAEN